MSFDKNTGKILKKTDANGIESSYSYDDGGKDGEQNGWVNEYLVRKIKTEVDYQELDAAGLVKFLKTNKEKEETFTIASIEYNENDDVISETEENGDITSSEYEDEKIHIFQQAKLQRMEMTLFHRLFMNMIPKGM